MNGRYSPVKTRGVVPHDIGDPGELCMIGYHEVIFDKERKRVHLNMEIVIILNPVFFSCGKKSDFNIKLNYETHI